MEPQYIQFTCSKLMQNRPNPQTISPSPGFLATNPTCPSGPNLCTEHWRWRSASSNSSPTPETFRGWGVGMDSFGWTVVIVRWTRVVFGGVDDISQKSHQAKSHLVLRFLAIYIYTHCTQYLTQYYYHINYLITAIMKSIYKNNNEKFWPPFSHLFKLPLPNFPFQKSSAPGSQSSLQHLVLSTWLVHIPWVCKARPSWRMEQSPPCLCNLARTGSRVCGLRFGKRHVIWDKYDIDIDIKRYSANGLEVLVFWTLYRC